MTPEPDWSFARRPFWLFSHVFAASIVVSFVALGFWQLSRHQERADFNELVASRSGPPALSLDAALDLAPGEIDYQLVRVSGTFADSDFVRVANRSQGGVAGEHVVALFALDDGRTLLVNRGFVPLGFTEDLRPLPAGEVALVGWLRMSVTKGWLGVADLGTGDVVPRLDVAAIAGRLVADQARLGTVPQWLLLADASTQEDNDGLANTASALATFPDPAPLPTLDGGPHLAYMGQWFIFATLGTGFYTALVRRNAKGKAKATPQPIEGEPPESALVP